ncbi:MAG: fibronectin type III domain-containing protein [Acutalibacteraceae bacterium]
MKKTLSMVLAAVLIFAVMTPITVFAENGPYPFDPDSEEVSYDTLSTLGILDLENGEIGFLYPESLASALPAIYSGASYDINTNTLTLKNVKSKTSVLVAIEMGEDFKINLIGYNELSQIASSSDSRGASVTITGSGELVLNRTRDYGGIDIDAGGTPSFLHIDDTAKVKVYSNSDTSVESVCVYGSTITDPAEIIKFGGNVKSPTPTFDTYTVEIYEQIEAHDLYWNSIDYYDAGFEKDGVFYVGYADYNPITYLPNGKYELYSVSYDEILDCYVATEYSDGETVKPTGFTILTEDEPIYDKARGCYIGFTDYSEDFGKPCKSIFLPAYSSPDTFDVCEDANGIKYGFYQYYYENEDGTVEEETYIYNLISHPTYGYVAVEDTTKTSLDGFTPIKIDEKKLADSYIYSTVVINNGGAVVEPATIKGIEVKNTNQGVKVSWTADSKAEKYRIYRKTQNSGWTTLDTVGADETSFIDKTAKSGTKYYYTVKGYNYVGWGGYNKTGVSITYVDAPQVTLKNSSSGIYLKWSKIANAKEYRIYRQTSGSSEWTRINTLTSTEWTDKTVKSGTTYNYRVTAVIGSTAGSYNTVSGCFLSAPKLDSVKNYPSGVTITWNKVSGAQGYRIYRKNSSGGWTRIGTTDNNKTFTFTDESVASGKNYTYTVVAYKDKTTSSYNKTGLTIKHLDAPQVTTKVYTNSIKLSWSEVAGAKEYVVYRKPAGSDKWTKLTTTTNLSFKDTNVKNNQTYYYAVRAVNGKTLSGYKTVKQLFLATPNITSVKSVEGGAKVNWEKVSGAEGYKIYRKTGSGSWTCVGTTKNNSTFTYTDKTVEQGKTYTYTVKAYKGNYCGYYNTTGVSVKIPKTQVVSYILNTNTLTIHNPGCRYVDQIDEENKESYSGDLNALYEEGYSTCKVCF